jgi:hypothetical protein
MMKLLIKKDIKYWSIYLKIKVQLIQNDYGHLLKFPLEQNRRTQYLVKSNKS